MRRHLQRLAAVARAITTGILITAGLAVIFAVIANFYEDGGERFDWDSLFLQLVLGAAPAGIIYTALRVASIYTGGPVTKAEVAADQDARREADRQSAALAAQQVMDGPEPATRTCPACRKGPYAAPYTNRDTWACDFCRAVLIARQCRTHEYVAVVPVTWTGWRTHPGCGRRMAVRLPKGDLTVVPSYMLTIYWNTRHGTPAASSVEPWPEEDPSTD